MNYNPVEQALTVDLVSPTAVVSAGRWVDAAGAQIAVAGARAYGVAFEDFSANDVVNASKTPAKKLTLTIAGFAEVELGGTVGDRVFVTTDNAGKTVVVANANDEILAFCPKGGTSGQRVRVLVLKNYDTRQPAANIAALAHAFGTADGTIVDVGGAFNQGTLNDNFKELSAKVNAILSMLQTQKIMT